MECLYDILSEAIKTTESLVKLLENENSIIQKHDKVSFETILKEKNNLIKKYVHITKETKKHLDDLQETYPEEINRLLNLTKRLNNICQENYNIINKEFEITNKIIKLIKKSITESKEYSSIVSAKI